MKLINLCLILLLGLTACNNTSTDQAATTTPAKPVNQREVDANIIAEYAKAKGLQGQTTSSGLYYVIEKQGEGESAKDLALSSGVTAHYHGTFLDGKVFDSSVERGEAYEFKLGGVIPAWREGLKLLNKGGKAILIVPSHLAYGAKGFPGAIGPNAVLRFDVELVDF